MEQDGKNPGASSHGGPGEKRDFRVSKGSVLLLFLWAVGMSAVLYSLVKPPEAESRRGDSIAQLSEQKGEVKFRPRESILWVDTREKQKFFNGDTVVTGDRSRVVIKLSDSQTIELGANSMVGLEMPIINASKQDLSVLLFKGTAVAASTGKVEDQSFLRNVLGKLKWAKGVAAKPITLSAADQAFRLPDSGAAQLALFKPAGDGDVRVTKFKGEVAVKSVDPVKQTPDQHLADIMDGNEVPTKLASDEPERVLTKADVVKAPPPPPPPPAAPKDTSLLSAALTKIDQALLNFSVKEEPPPPPKPVEPPRLKLPPAPVPPTPEELAAQAEKERLERERLANEAAEALRREVPVASHLPRFVTGQNFQLVTGESMRSGCTSQDIPVEIEPRPGAPEPRGWIPYLEIVSVADSSQRIRIEGENAFKKQKFVVPFEKICQLQRNKKAVGISMQLVAGVRYQPDGAQAAAPESQRMFLGSLADWPQVPITVFVDSLTKGTNAARGGWMPQQRIQGGAPKKIAIRLDNAQSLMRLFDLIAASGRFAFDSNSLTGDDLVQFAANSSVVANMRTSTVDRETIRQFAMRIDATVAFVGERDDIFDMPKAKVNRAGLLRSFVQKKGGIQVVTRNRIVTLSAADVKDDSSALKAVATSASSAIATDAKIVVP